MPPTREKDPRDPDTLSEHATVLRAPPPNDSLRDRELATPTPFVRGTGSDSGEDEDPTERMAQVDLSGARTMFHPGAGSQLTPADGLAAIAAAPFEKRYELRNVLGVGGMGEVRLCKDRLIGREVALKVLRAEASSAPGAMERFMREARVQGQLEHPAVVPVHDLGATPEGTLYFTMKRVRGKTLDHVLYLLGAGDRDTAARYSRRKLLTAFTSVCLAVDFAHAIGVLHRDLKPANIMLGDFGEVSVLDWGLAKVAGAADADAGAGARKSAVASGGSTPIELPRAGTTPHQTALGVLMGTPGYMSPEQARGQIDRLDARSDVYSLGAILFEMLALTPLHPGPDAMAMLDSTVRGVEARPSARGIADVPPEIEAICVKATALDPAQRYPSARALCDAVERFLDGDRDLQLRRELATMHAAAARAKLETARQGGSGSQAARAEALREAGRALAIDPNNADAMAAMAALVMNVPDRLPPEAEAELEAAESSERRATARAHAARMGVWAAMVPVGLALGVHSRPMVAVVIAAIATSVITSVVIARRSGLRPRHSLLLLSLTNLTVAVMGLVFGPFIMVPGLAATNAMFFAGQLDGRARKAVIVTGVLAVAAPFALETVGLLPAAYSFHHGVMQVAPRALELPEVPTTLCLLLVSIAMVILPALMAGRMRDSLRAAERRLFLQAWHLSQLVPEQARDQMAWRKILRATRPRPR